MRNRSCSRWYLDPVAPLYLFAVIAAFACAANEGRNQAPADVDALLRCEWDGWLTTDANGAFAKIGWWKVYLKFPNDDLQCAMEFMGDAELKDPEWCSESASVTVSRLDDLSGPQWTPRHVVFFMAPDNSPPSPFYLIDNPAMRALRERPAYITLDSFPADQGTTRCRLPRALVDRLASILATRPWRKGFISLASNEMKEVIRTCLTSNRATSIADEK